MIKRVLPLELRSELQLGKSMIGVVESKNAQKMLGILRKLDVADTFLKRIRASKENGKVDVFVCEKHAFAPAIQQALEEVVLEFKEMDLPMSAPCTPEQHKEWSVYWPINYSQTDETRQIEHSLEQLNTILGFKGDMILFTDSTELLRVQATECVAYRVDHPVMQLLDRWKESPLYTKQTYFLRGLSLFVEGQLCGMCSMALVHSRLQRIYCRGEMSVRMQEILSMKKSNHRVIMLQIL